MNKKTVAIIIVLVICCVLLQSQKDATEREDAMRQNNYRDMVCLWELTSGEAGWPNFKNIEVVCSDLAG